MKLKPCPFCGEDNTDVDTINNRWLFLCASCGARTYGFTGIGTEEQATKDWNHRPLEDQLKAHAVEVLANEIRQLYKAPREGGYEVTDEDRAEARALLGWEE